MPCAIDPNARGLRVTPPTCPVTHFPRRVTLFPRRVTLFGRRVTLRVTLPADNQSMNEVLP
jgi:hypothetical protein